MKKSLEHHMNMIMLMKNNNYWSKASSFFMLKFKTNIKILKNIFELTI